MRTPEPELATPLPALSIDRLRAGTWPRELSFAAPAGSLTSWLGGNDSPTPELSLALAGRYRPISGTVTILGRPATATELRREVVLARLLDAVEPEPRLRVSEFLHSCQVLHGSRHNRLTPAEAAAESGLDGLDLHRKIEDLSAAERLLVAVSGAVLSRPVAVIVDRADHGLTDQEWSRSRDALNAAAAATGCAIVASISRTDPEVIR